MVLVLVAVVVSGCFISLLICVGIVVAADIISFDIVTVFVIILFLLVVLYVHIYIYMYTQIYIYIYI